eukprot:766058-Hanusia_phi.AAC.8
MQTEFLEREEDNKLSALATSVEGAESQRSSVSSPANEAAKASGLNLSLGANLSGEAGHESKGGL